MKCRRPLTREGVAMVHRDADGNEYVYVRPACEVPARPTRLPTLDDYEDPRRKEADE